LALKAIFEGSFALNLPSAGIFKQSVEARNRGGIWLSYRPARLHKLAEFIPPYFLKVIIYDPIFFKVIINDPLIFDKNSFS
jgi:hypothetical protein